MATRSKQKAVEDYPRINIGDHPAGTRLLYITNREPGSDFVHCDEAIVKEWAGDGQFVRIYEPSIKRFRWIHAASPLAMKVVLELNPRKPKRRY